MLLHTFDKTHCETLSGIVEVWQRYPFFAWIAYVGRKKKIRENCKYYKKCVNLKCLDANINPLASSKIARFYNRAVLQHD